MSRRCRTRTRRSSSLGTRYSVPSKGCGSPIGDGSRGGQSGSPSSLTSMRGARASRRERAASAASWTAAARDCSAAPCAARVRSSEATAALAARGVSKACQATTTADTDAALAAAMPAATRGSITRACSHDRVPPVSYGRACDLLFHPPCTAPGRTASALLPQAGAGRGDRSADRVGAVASAAQTAPSRPGPGRPYRLVTRR